MKKNIKILFTFIFVLFFTNKVIACELFNTEIDLEVMLYNIKKL